MERLGWLTNCPNVTRCPQNWLELCVSEIPTQVGCDTCRQNVLLVGTESEYEHARADRLAAWPVVPPIAVGPPFSGPVPAARTDDFPSPPAALTAEPPPTVQDWRVTMSNGDQVPIDRSPMVIGRSRACDLILPSAKVSRQHATLTLVDGELFIEDLGSANGLFRDGQRISREKLRAGDVIIISDMALRFEPA